MDCPNKCGELVEIKKPSMIVCDWNEWTLLDEAALKENATFCHLIERICPKCGYADVRSLTSAQFDEYLKRAICPKCGVRLEPDLEDSSELECPKCGYGFREDAK